MGRSDAPHAFCLQNEMTRKLDATRNSSANIIFNTNFHELIRNYSTNERKGKRMVFW